MRNLLFATAFTAALGTAAPVFAETPTPTPTETADEIAYAQQEAQNPEAQEFVGGSTVIFIGSTTAMILAVVLLLLIL